MLKTISEVNTEPKKLIKEGRSRKKDVRLLLSLIC